VKEWGARVVADLFTPETLKETGLHERGFGTDRLVGGR
jgi:hypothetical protein